MLTWQWTESTNKDAIDCRPPAGVRARGAWWRLPLLLAVVLAAILIVRATRSR